MKANPQLVSAFLSFFVFVAAEAQVEVWVETNRPFDRLVNDLEQPADVLKKQFEENVVAALSAQLIGAKERIEEVEVHFTTYSQTPKPAFFLKSAQTVGMPYRFVYHEDASVTRVGSEVSRSRGKIVGGGSSVAAVRTAKEVEYRVRTKITFDFQRWNGSAYVSMKKWGEDYDYNTSSYEAVAKGGGRELTTSTRDARVLWPPRLKGILWRGFVDIQVKPGAWDKVKRSATHTLQVKNLSPWPLTGLKTVLYWEQRQRNTYSDRSISKSEVDHENIRIAPGSSSQLPAECKTYGDTEVRSISDLEVRYAACLFDIAVP